MIIWYQREGFWETICQIYKNTVGEDMWMGSICYYLSVWCSVGDMLHQKHISACRNADNDYISKIIGSQLTWFCRLCGFLLVIQFGPPITVHMIIYLQGVFWLLVKPLHYPIYSLWGPRRGKYGYYSRHCSYHLILHPKQGSLCAGKSMWKLSWRELVVRQLMLQLNLPRIWILKQIQLQIRITL